MGKIAGIVFVVAVLLGAWWFMSKDSTTETNELPIQSMPVLDEKDLSAPTTRSETIPEEKLKTYTMAEVATHADQSSCWTAIRGNVYDLTGAIDKHPGGPDKILYLCGRDGTEAFTGQHGGMEKPEAGLEQTKIGVLAE